MKMREFLFMMKDLKLINTDLTPKAIVDILASDDPKITDDEGAINMEPEVRASIAFIKYLLSQFYTDHFLGVL
jgi:hypothetical protein